MSSQPIDVGSSSPSTKASLLTALHNAMETNVKVNQSSLSGTTTQDSTDQTPKKTPPTAPPSISSDQYISRRVTRSQSLSVKSTRSGPDYFHVPGQFNGQLVPFDPRAEFQRLSDGSADSLPRSSLQLEESSTILHPSEFRQIVPFDTKFASGMDSRGRPRRHTISGARMSQRVPSAYREVLIQKAIEDKQESQKARALQQRAGQAPTSTQQPTTGAAADASSEPSQVVGSRLNPFYQGDSAPKPSPPRPRRKAPKTDGEDESLDSEEEKEENDKTADPSPTQSPAEEQLEVFGLQYAGGLIDFVDHPPTTNAPLTATIPPVTEPEETTIPTTEKTEDMLDMERAMSPHPSS